MATEFIVELHTEHDLNRRIVGGDSNGTFVDAPTVRDAYGSVRLAPRPQDQAAH